jgi:hypothetical protein
MGIPTKPPGGGGKGRHTHWSYVSTECGKTWAAWLAGPIHWFDCHLKGRTKPCVHAMTDGELHCDMCSPLNPVEEAGYVPLYREIDAKPVCVIVHEYQRETVDRIRKHQMVLVGRGEQQSDPVWVREHPKQGQRYTSSLAERMADADMTVTLLAMWKLPALTDWYYRTHGKSDKPVSLPPGKAVRDDGHEYTPMLQGAAKRWAAPVIKEPTAVGDVIDVQREELARLARAKPSSNGHHKPK